MVHYIFHWDRATNKYSSYNALTWSQSNYGWRQSHCAKIVKINTLDYVLTKLQNAFSRVGDKTVRNKNNLLIYFSDVDLKYFFLFFGDETVRNTIYLLFYFRDVDLKCFFLQFPKIGHFPGYGNETKRKNRPKRIIWKPI